MTEQDDVVYTIIGHAIQRIRKQANISQQELANYLGMNRVSIVNIEAGRQHLPIHTLYNIAKRFDVSIAMFFQEEPITQEEIINTQLRLELVHLHEQLSKIRSIMTEEI
jgi:transcriptional regulator with XRE-family HTH domain